MLIDLVINIEISILYEATVSYSKNTLKSIMRIYEFAKEKIENIPDIHKMKISKYSEQFGWEKESKKESFD